MNGLKKRTVLVLGGPTASGKSGLALFAARKYNGTIINADSMQVYRALPLLTAQPSPEDLGHAPHRLYGFLEPTDGCSAARWKGLALDEINKAHEDHRLPIIVGGTGFYIKTLLNGISPIPEVGAEIRAAVAKRQQEMGNPAFHAELQRLDPDMAESLDPFNTQRLVRAREVLEATGRSLAYWQSLPREQPPPHLHFIVVKLLPPREQLYRQCNSRFETMLQQGAVEEARAFLSQITAGRIPADVPLAKALGYPELSSWLSGDTTREAACIAAQQATRNYAKRQVTWFRHQIHADLVLDSSDTEKLSGLLEGFKTGPL